MTTEGLRTLHGRSALYRLGSLVFEVTITDTRSAYGRDDVLITPVAGNGSRWVTLTSITLEGVAA